MSPIGRCCCCCWLAWLRLLRAAGGVCPAAAAAVPVASPAAEEGTDRRRRSRPASPVHAAVQSFWTCVSHVIRMTLAGPPALGDCYKSGELTRSRVPIKAKGTQKVRLAQSGRVTRDPPCLFLGGSSSRDLSWRASERARQTVEDSTVVVSVAKP